MKLRRWFEKNRLNGQRGISLLEAAVAVFLLGGCVLTLVLSLSTGALGVQKDDQEVTAQGLARTQMEMIKNSSYDVSGASYPAVTVPAGYTVAVGIAAVPGAGPDIQKVTATVNKGGDTIYTLQDYRVNR